MQSEFGGFEMQSMDDPTSHFAPLRKNKSVSLYASSLSPTHRQPPPQRPPQTSERAGANFLEVWLSRPPKLWEPKAKLWEPGPKLWEPRPKLWEPRPKLWEPRPKLWELFLLLIYTQTARPQSFENPDQSSESLDQNSENPDQSSENPDQSSEKQGHQTDQSSERLGAPSI